MPTLKPTGTRLLIDPGKEELKTKARLYLPPAQIPEHPVEGVIIAKGPECTLFDVGDRVIFQKHTAFKVTLGQRNEQVYLVVEERAVVCELILSPEEEAEHDTTSEPQAVNPNTIGEGITSRDWIPYDHRVDPGPFAG